MKTRKTSAIVGIIMISFSVITYTVGSAIVQELGGQSNKHFFPEEIRLDLRESNRIAYQFAVLAVSSIPVFLVGIPATIYGFVQKFSFRMAVITGILLLIAYGIMWLLAYPFT
jgi:hypothetical protein